MNWKQAQEAGYDGLELIKTVSNWTEMRVFIEMIVAAGIARCVSPERDTLCAHPATHVHWQDQAEWYECCEAHRIPYGQWSGSTTWYGNRAVIAVIPELAIEWKKTAPPALLEGIRYSWYKRPEY